jgi:hypothetical protein
VSSLQDAIRNFYQQESASGRKVFLPREPASNLDGLRTFSFFAEPFSPLSAEDISIRDEMLRKIRVYLTGNTLPATDQFAQNEFDTIVGNMNNRVVARFFVIHDRAADDVAFNPANVNAGQSGVHLFMDHLSNFFRQRDYDQAGHATKFERALTNATDPRFFQDNLWPAGISAFQNRGFQNNDFIHVEMTATTAGNRIRANAAVPQGYTRKQVLAVALAYISASLRRGIFLTVTVHREVDRGINMINGGQFKWGHSDPRNFDINAFYAAVNELLFQFGFGTNAQNVGFTFGIDANRMNIDNAGNRSDSLHTLPNQYGPRRNKPNNWNNAGTIRINCGGNNFTIVDPIFPNPDNPGAQLRRGEAYVFQCGGPFLHP